MQGIVDLTMFPSALLLNLLRICMAILGIQCLILKAYSVFVLVFTTSNILSLILKSGTLILLFSVAHVFVG